MGRVMACLSLSGQSDESDVALGSSRLTESLSASIPIEVTSSGEVPGMTFAWT